MTYRQLLEKLQGMRDSQLDQDVTVLQLDAEETSPVIDFVHDWKTEDDVDNQDSAYHAAGVHLVEGVLDDGHPYLTIA